MTETGLILPGVENTIIGQDTLDNFGSSGILPRLQINALNSKLTAAGAAPPGDWLLVTSTSNQPLGKVIDVMPLAVRPMAIDMSGKANVVIFDHESPYFKDIVAKAAASPSGQLKEYMAGPQALFLFPNGSLCTFFMHNSSTSGIYVKIKANMRRWLTASSKTINGKKGPYFAPEIQPGMVNHEIDPAELDNLARQVNAFCNPPKQETVSEVDGRAQ